MSEIGGSDPARAVLAELHELAGKPSSRELSTDGLAATSVRNLLGAGSVRTPRMDTVAAFVSACLAYAGRRSRSSRLTSAQRRRGYWLERYAEAAAQRGVIDGRRECPYPGLAPFGIGEARWFFGRETLVADLVDRLDARLKRGGIQMVVAPSGAGKSSLLGAGLIPAINAGALPGSEEWPVVRMTPTAQPIEALATALAAGGVYVDSTTERAKAVQDAVNAVEGSPVLVVDQAEELFTLCADPSERRLFLDVLAALSARGRTALVVLGVRADFYADCAQDPVLRTALQDRQLIVGQLTLAELTDAIRKPAADVGLALEPGLVKILLNDLGVGHDNPAAATYAPERLPLLAHTLRMCWQQRDGRTLTVAGYERTGGIQGAIQRTADETFRSLDDGARLAAETIFPRLVRLGDHTNDTRQRRPRRDLVDGTGLPADTARAIDAFIAARLLTAHDETIEITHEVLLHAWPLLRTWVNTNRANQLIGQELRDNAHRWETTPDPSLLYRGNRLRAARTWVDTASTADRTGSVLKFLEAGTNEEHEELHRVRTSAIAWVEETRKNDRSTALAIALAVVEELPPDQSGLFALWSFLVRPTAGRLVVGNTAPISTTAWIPGAAELVSVGEESSMCRWSAAGELRDWLRLPEGKDFLISPDAGKVAVAQPDDTILVVRLPDGDVIARLDPDENEIYRQEWWHSPNWAWSPDGRKLVFNQSTDSGWTSAIWRVPDSERGDLKSLVRIHRAFGQPVWSPDGKVVAFVNSSGVWLVKERFRKATRLAEGHFTCGAWSPSNAAIAVIEREYDRRFGVVYDLTGKVVSRRMLAETWRSATDDSISWSPDEKRIAITIRERKRRSIDLLSSVDLSVLDTVDEGDVYGPLVWTSDSRFLSIPSPTQAVILVWDSASRRTTRIGVNEITRTVWAPDSRRALVTQGGSVRVAGPHLLDRIVLDGLSSPYAWAPAGGHIAAVRSDGGGVEIRPVTSDVPSAHIKTMDVSNIAWSPLGDRIATSGHDSPVRVWDVATGRLIAEIGGIAPCAWSPDGTRIACSDGSGLTMWAIDGRLPRKIWTCAQAASIVAIAWRPAADVLAVTVGTEGMNDIHLVDASTGAPLTRCVPGSGATSLLAWAPDGAYLAGAHDRDLVIWAGVTGEKLAKVGVPGTSTAINWSSDRVLTVTDNNGHLYHFDVTLDRDALVEAARSAGARKLSSAERLRYGLPTNQVE